MSRENAVAMVTEAPKPQAPVDIVSPTTQETPQVTSTQFAQFARKEAEFVKKQQELKRERDAWMSEKAKADELLKKGQQFDETSKRSKIEALRLLGWSDTDIFNVINELQPAKEQTPEEKAEQIAAKTVDQKLKEYQDAQAAEKLKAQTESDQKALTEFRTDLGSFVESNKEKYEYCAHYGPIAVDLAYKTVLQVVKDSKGEDIPTIEEAIEMVEQFYEEQDKLMSSIKKRQPKVETPVVEETKEAPKSTRTTMMNGADAPKPAIQKNRTLSNDAARATMTGAARTVETKEQKRARLEEVLRTGNAALLRK